jgi:hypothetical protein
MSKYEEEKRNKSFKIPVTREQVIHEVTLRNHITGEVETIEIDNERLLAMGTKHGQKPKNGMKKYDGMKSYHRRSNRGWELLRQMVTPRQYIVADKLANMARAFTSSLEPLNPDSTISEVSNVLGVNRNTIKDDIDRLFKVGVIGKFEVYDKNERHTKYWLFNTFLSFNGDVIKEGVEDLFKNTYFAAL